MKPLKLAIQAFGPYVQEQIIDFTELGPRTFFLIHGPTGSGKTSILDAISYALYGESSGTERKSDHIRSSLAPANLLTKVIFEFALGKDTYKIERIPEQLKPGKKDGKPGLLKGDATLWRGTNVIATGAQKVSQAVHNLLGFRSEEFRQVVLLPQGKFRDFLIARSSDREKILETLFKTEFYKRIEEALIAASKDVGQTVQQLKQKQAALLEQAQVQTVHELEEQSKIYKEELVALARSLEKAKADEQASQNNLSQARTIEQKFAQAKSAQEKLLFLEQQNSKFAELESRLVLSKKAETLKPKESLLDTRKKELTEANSKLANAKQALEQASSREKVAKTLLEEQQEKEPEQARGVTYIDKLESMLSKVTTLFNLSQNLANSESSLKDSESKLAKISVRILELKHEQKQKQDKLTALQQLSSKKEALSQQLDIAKKSLYQFQLYKRNQEQTKEAQAKELESQKKLLVLESELVNSQTTLGELESLWYNGQASVLAKHLAPGEPCTVCGSTEHPKPASASSQIPSQEEITAQRKTIKGLQEQVEKSQQDHLKLQSVVLEAQAKTKAASDQLGEFDNESLEKEVLDLNAKLQEADRATSELTTTQAALEKTIEDQAKADELSVKLSQDLNDLKAKREADKALLSHHESEVPEKFRDLNALTKEIERAKNKLSDLKKSLEQAHANFNASAKVLASAQANLDNATTEGKISQEKYEKETTSFSAALQEQGFSTIEDYEKAKTQSEKILQIEQEVNEYKTNLQAARQTHSERQKDLEGLAMPETASLEQALSLAKQAKEVLLQKEATTNEQLSTTARLIKSLIEIAGNLQALEQEYSVVGTLSEAAKGNNQFGVTFQRFVLGSLLDDVLIAASSRLKLMSKGRYFLQRLASRIDARRSGGLDLEVFDNYTGTTRPVATLSGGEGFLASLCLALGLADVVQSYSGGIYLETIFIDEGFGSLDPESLDLALRTLIDLQKGGRLVGIISHVPELKERIETRLEVMGGRNGSSARFVVN